MVIRKIQSTITIDLQNEYNINTIRLLISQHPQGVTTHNIYAGTTLNNLTIIKTFNESTKDNDWLTYYMQDYKKIRYVKIETTRSPSWISWREIKIYGTIDNKEGDPEKPLTNIALNKKVTASNTIGTHYASNLTDGNINTLWNSGKFPTQSFTLDLNEIKTFNTIELYANQSPTGLSTHKIYIGNNLNSLKLIKTISQITSNTDILDIFIENNQARYIKIITTKGPSWVSWKEIKVYNK